MNDAPVSLAALTLAVGSFVSVAATAAAIDAPFRDLSAESLAGLPPRGEYEAPLPLHFRALEVDLGALEDLLALAPAEGGAAALAAPLILTLPYPDGSDQRFRVEESPIMETALARRFPEIRTFTVQGIDDPTASGRVSLTPLGFHAMVLSSAGTLYIDPYRRWQGEVVLAYFQSQAVRRPGDAARCEFQDEEAAAGSDSDGSAAETGAFAEAPGGPASAIASGSTLRTYRLALAATGEYSTRVCLPNPVAVACAMSAIVVSMNRVGGIYEREVAVRMVLIANNDLVVYTNGATDPYTNNDGFAMLAQNQTNLTTVIGSANYDIGHVFSTGGGGVASLSVPCVSTSKARGVTGLPNPIGDPFDVDFVAHEMGHQWGGLHTFNGTTSNCGGGNRSASAAYEPGSGSTIMAYAGICGAENLQLHSDDIFHTKSFDQIVAYSTGATGNSCAVSTATGNTPPEVDAGAAFTIPKQTPFTLTGLAADADGDSLTYLWEEYDLGRRGAAQHRRRRGPADLPLVRPADRSEPHLPAPLGHPGQRRDARRVDVDPRPHHDLPPDGARQPDRRRGRQLGFDHRDGECSGGTVPGHPTEYRSVVGGQQRPDGDLGRRRDRRRTDRLRRSRDRALDRRRQHLRRRTRARNAERRLGREIPPQRTDDPGADACHLCRQHLLRYLERQLHDHRRRPGGAFRGVGLCRAAAASWAVRSSSSPG